MNGGILIWRENMKQVNIAYDYEYDEVSDKTIALGKVDIIELSDEVANNIDFYVQKFFDWSSDKANGCFHYDKALKKDICQTTSTDFVRFVNNELKMQAKVIKVNTNLNPTLPIVEF